MSPPRLVQVLASWAVAFLLMGCGVDARPEEGEQPWGQAVWGSGDVLTIDEFRALAGPSRTGEAWRVPARNGRMYAIPMHPSLEPGYGDSEWGRRYTISFRLTESPPRPIDNLGRYSSSIPFEVRFTTTTDVFEGSAHSWPVPDEAEQRTIALSDGRSFSAEGTGWDCEESLNNLPEYFASEPTPEFWIDLGASRIYARCTLEGHRVSNGFPQLSCTGMWRANDWDAMWSASSQAANTSCEAIAARFLALVVDVPVVFDSWAEQD